MPVDVTSAGNIHSSDDIGRLVTRAVGNSTLLGDPEDLSEASVGINLQNCVTSGAVACKGRHLVAYRKDPAGRRRKDYARNAGIVNAAGGRSGQVLGYKCLGVGAINKIAAVGIAFVGA